MSRSINSDKSWNSTDDELDECDNSSNSNCLSRRVSCTDDISGQLITTHSMSAVIRPGSKMPRTDPLQFVKIQNNDLSKKAVEQIKLAEEVKITKEKIKEVEEEWQNNLLNWKSKRRISKSNSDDQSGTSASAQRKTKTFSEILSEKAKSGHRIGYNLHKYLDGEIDNENELLFEFDNNYESNTDNDRNSDESYKSDNYDSNSTTDKHIISKKSGLGDVIVFDTALLEEFNCNRNHDQRQDSSEDDDSISGEVINNSSHSSKNICRDNNSNNDLLILPNSIDNEHENNNKNKLHVIENYNVVNNKNQDIQQLNATRDEKNLFSENKLTMADIVTQNKPEKVKVEIKDWKMQNQRENVLQYLLQQEQNVNHQQRVKHQNDLNNDEYISADNHYNHYDAEDDDYDEEMERLRLEQEKSFRAKLSAFEMLAKQENENIYASVKPNNDNKVKTKEDAFKRQPPAVEELLQSEQLQQLMSPPRQIYSGQYLDDNDEESEDAINARIEQLQIERQRAQQARQQSLLLNQPRSGHVVYQSIDYPESPPQQQHQHNRHFEKQQYYLVDEPIVKQNQIPVKQTQLPSSPPKSTPNQSIQAQQSFQTTLPPQEHLYVNQKQLFVNQMHPQFYDQIESRERFRSPSPLNKEYTENNVIYDSQKQVPPVQQTALQLPSQTPQDSNPTQAQHQQYLYYPKPYIANKSAPIQQQHQQQVPSIQKPVTALPQQKQQTVPQPQPQQNRPQSQPPLQQQLSSSAKPPSKPQPPASKPKPQQKGYNQNHWLLQEAELRRHLAAIPSATTKQQSHQAVPTQRQTISSNSSTHKTPPLAPPKGMLSVSGKKKCSSCGDELGRGCAAMVVESLSLYYHISCFRCSVCNIQLGNGTVGTDVRVRNHKLHCQNCYSNDEAGLKFSRV